MSDQVSEKKDFKTEEIKRIFEDFSKLMGVEVTLIQDEVTQKVEPHFDLNSAISKLLALMVYSSITVPASIAPPYNRVHADVEFWKSRLDTLEKESQAKEQ